VYLYTFLPVRLLVCTFSPEPSIVWKRRGRTVQGGRYIIQNFESELIIKKVEQSDEGEYVCSATNSASSRPEDQTIYVDVQGKVYHVRTFIFVAFAVEIRQNLYHLGRFGHSVSEVR
jgi:Immunoglobulin I-set domain